MGDAAQTSEVARQPVSRRARSLASAVYQHAASGVPYICRELRKSRVRRLVFVGDTAMRQLYLAVVLMLLPPEAQRNPFSLAPASAWAPSTRGEGWDGRQMQCNWTRVMLAGAGDACTNFFARDTSRHFGPRRRRMLCGGSLDLEFVYGGMPTTRQLRADDPASSLRAAEAEYPRLLSADATSSAVVLGWGSLLEFDASATEAQLLDHIRVLQRWPSMPRLFWVGADRPRQPNLPNLSPSDAVAKAAAGVPGARAEETIRLSFNKRIAFDVLPRMSVAYGAPVRYVGFHGDIERRLQPHVGGAHSQLKANAFKAQQLLQSILRRGGDARGSSSLLRRAKRARRSLPLAAGSAYIACVLGADQSEWREAEQMALTLAKLADGGRTPLLVLHSTHVPKSALEKLSRAAAQGGRRVQTASLRTLPAFPLASLAHPPSGGEDDSQAGYQCMHEAASEVSMLLSHERLANARYVMWVHPTARLQASVADAFGMLDLLPEIALVVSEASDDDGGVLCQLRADARRVVTSVDGGDKGARTCCSALSGQQLMLMRAAAMRDARAATGRIAAGARIASLAASSVPPPSAAPPLQAASGVIALMTSTSTQGTSGTSGTYPSSPTSASVTTLGHSARRAGAAAEVLLWSELLWATRSCECSACYSRERLRGLVDPHAQLTADTATDAQGCAPRGSVDWVCTRADLPASNLSLHLDAEYTQACSVHFENRRRDKAGAVHTGSVNDISRVSSHNAMLFDLGSRTFLFFIPEWFHEWFQGGLLTIHFAFVVFIAMCSICVVFPLVAEFCISEEPDDDDLCPP